MIYGYFRKLLGKRRRWHPHCTDARADSQRSGVMCPRSPHPCITAPWSPPALSVFRALPMRASALTLTSASLYQSKWHRPVASAGPVVWTKPWGTHRGHSSRHLEQFAKPTLAGGRARIQDPIAAPCHVEARASCASGGPEGSGAGGGSCFSGHPRWAPPSRSCKALPPMWCEDSVQALTFLFPKERSPTRMRQMTAVCPGRRTSLQDYVARFIN